MTETIWGSNAPPGIPLTGGPYCLGTVFSVTTAGVITGARYFSTIVMTGVHTATLWDPYHLKLAQVTFPAAISEGWQVASFQTPITLIPFASYVMSMDFNDNNYLQLNGFSGKVNQDIVVGEGSGVWGVAGVYPQNTGDYAFYVDVAFVPQIAPPSPIPLATFSTNQSRVFNTLDSGSIVALSLSIFIAMNNGAFATNVWYLWTENEVHSVVDVLTSLGYATSISLWADGTYRLSISWPH